RVMIGQRDDAGGELDALRALGRGGEEHLRRADHLPAGGVVLAAPEFVIAELVQMLDQVEVAAELQQRVLADRMVRGEKGAKTETRHGMSPIRACLSSSFPRTREARANVFVVHPGPPLSRGDGNQLGRLYALDDAQVAVGGVAERAQRLLVASAVMR